jgi:hypothetical protein
MKTVSRIMLICMLPLIAACGPLPNGTTNYPFDGVSGFASVDGTNVRHSLDSSIAAGGDSNARGSYGYVRGFDRRDGWTVLAGVDPYSNMGYVPTGGTAIFHGNAEFVSVENITTFNGQVSGTSASGSIPITLYADFGNGALTGGDYNNTFNVNGIIYSRGNLGGTVDFLGIPGQLDGEVGTHGAVGAFHGGESNNFNFGDVIYAGGFIVQ